MSLNNILIVGGTGTLGRELVPLLKQHGKNVFVMTRSPDKHGSLNSAGVQLVKGDLTEPDSMRGACKGIDAVILAAHSLVGKGKYSSKHVDGEGVPRMIEAAKLEGVKYVSFVSVMWVSADHPLPFWRAKFNAENVLKQSGLTYNIIRPTAFMEFHVKVLMGDSILKKGKANILGKGQNPTNFVSAKDVARIMYECLEDPKHHNQTIEVGGPENLSRLQVVKLYSEKLGKTIKVNHVPRSTVRFLSKVLKPFHPGISEVMQMAELNDRVDQTFDTGPLLQKFPMRLTYLREVI